MIYLIQRNITRFVVLILLQGFLFNNIEFGHYLTPYMYVLFIILMPFETPKWFFIFAGFLLGLGVDAFENPVGMHAAASVLIGFLRPSVLQYFSPRDGYEKNTFPRVYYYGLPWFTKYAAILIFIHHTCFFMLEVFSFQSFHLTLLRIVLNSLFTLLLIVISQYIVYRK